MYNICRRCCHSFYTLMYTSARHLDTSAFRPFRVRRPLNRRRCRFLMYFPSGKRSPVRVVAFSFRFSPTGRPRRDGRGRNSALKTVNRQRLIVTAADVVFSYDVAVSEPDVTAISRNAYEQPASVAYQVPK